MNTRKLVVIIAAVALVSGIVGAMVVTALLDDSPTAIKQHTSADQDPKPRARFTVAQAEAQITDGIQVDISTPHGGWGVNSSSCEPADDTGRRFRCGVFIQQFNSTDGGFAPDNGVGARYGVTPNQSGGQSVKVAATYSDDGQQISWSPGGGTALLSDLAARQEQIDKAQQQASAPPEDESTSEPNGPEDSGQLADRYGFSTDPVLRCHENPPSLSSAYYIETNLATCSEAFGAVEDCMAGSSGDLPDGFNDAIGGESGHYRLQKPSGGEVWFTTSDASCAGG
jgi:hypothetical protein